MSRLLNSQQFQNIRNDAQARNLYGPNNPYEIENPLLVESINTIAGIINTSNAFDITNNILGRSIAIGPQTPIVQIGSRQLSEQFIRHIANRATTEIIPSINLKNIFDGDPNTKFLTRHIEWKITKDDSKTKMGRFIEKYTGLRPETRPRFEPKTDGEVSLTPIELIQNTGKGQLSELVKNIGRNSWIPTVNIIETLIAQGVSVKNITYGINYGKKAYSSHFTTNNDNGYFNYPFATSANIDLTAAEVDLKYDHEKFRTYTTTEEFKSQFGITDTRRKRNVINPDDFGHNDNIDGQLIWGQNIVVPSKFNVKTGLLRYTKALLTSRGLKHTSMDQTIKEHLRGDEFVSFRGSGVGLSHNGVRSHTVNDQYSGYSKAIRFQGNEIYGGDVNSVIHRSVIPKFHPVIGDDLQINNKNMMFSIENLAYQLNLNGDVSDDLSTVLPKCEIGPHMGRVMWFPPYDIQLTENAIARHEVTEFIGRGEPVYTYNNSERTATLGFKLIIDYPPQAKGRDHVQNSEFFAFGGTDGPVSQATDIGQKEKDKEILRQELNEIQPQKVVKNPDPIKEGEYVNYHFQNDWPTADNLSKTGIKTLKILGYEDGLITRTEDQSELNEIGNIDYGLNKTFDADLNTLLFDVLKKNSYDLYKLVFTGYASKLHPPGNDSLAIRRATELRNYAENIFVAGSDFTSFQAAGIQVEIIGASDNFAGSDGALAENMHLKPVRNERRGIIELKRNGVQRIIENDLTPKQKLDRKKYIDEINGIDTQIKRATVAANSDCVFNFREIDQKYSKGFEDLFNNRFQGTFHSQTPEDFHRRLTFLQQCTRQGRAVRTETEDGVVSAKNSAFGRPPVCVLRLGDFFHTKIIIDNISFDYIDSPWDVNPEGMGMQFMIANITISMRLIGGQSLAAPIAAIQNAETPMFYANSSFYDTGIYRTAKFTERIQIAANKGIDQLEVVLKEIQAEIKLSEPPSADETF